MTIDTLAYTKVLEKAGVDRSVAEAHAEAMVQHVFPQLMTKTDGERMVHTLTIRFIGFLLTSVGLTVGLIKFL